MIVCKLGTRAPLDLGGIHAHAIVVPRRGGLGNQLFQLAAALQGQRLTGGRLFFTRTDDSLRSSDVQLEDMVGDLPQAKVAQLASFLWPPQQTPRWLLRWNRRLRRKLGLGLIVWKMDGGIMEQIEKSFFGDNLLFDGLFQSPGCYEAAVPDVAGQLLRHRLPNAVTVPDAMAVSFRLGEDFTSRGWSIGLDYYQAAIERLDPHRRMTLWPMTDTAGLPRDMADFLHSLGRRIKLPGELSDKKGVSDFWNIARAGKVVLSPSTFTWWAAATGDVMHCPQESRVAFPDPWQPVAKTILCRESWIKVQWSFRK